MYSGSGDCNVGEGKPAVPDADQKGKRLSVERIYQKKTPLEHILLRPDTYIGSVETLTEEMWVYDEEQECMTQRSITYVPGLFKIFDEILVNAADNKQRDDKMDTIKIDIDPVKNQIRIWNNGKGIPVVKHKTEGVYVPSLIFGHLLTSSNYDDSEKKVTGGRNGYGAKLCNIFSTKFTVETSCSEYRKSFRQTWSGNMSRAGEMKLDAASKADFTCITFQPDLAKFKMTSLDADTVALLTRRAWDIAAASRGVKVILNGKRLPIKNFQDYVELFTKNRVDDLQNPLKVTYERVSPRWEVAVAASDNGFQHMSFVNSIATTKGGRHVDYVADQIVSKILDVVKKKNKSGIQIKPLQVRSHLWVFVNCLIENPTFDSQTKENMTLQSKSFGSKCAITDKFLLQVQKSGIVENILSWVRAKAQQQLQGKGAKAKRSKIKGIPKLDDANDAGTKNSQDCTLILTEGDSAKTVAVAGLGVVGRDRYGVFPLRGKVLNVREATHSQIMENAEISNLCKIVGLQYKQKYSDPEQLRSLRYGKIMIMTDQDQDGSHIKGLIINFLHHFWPNLLKLNFVEQFITPIVKVSKGQQLRAFYSLPEFEEWKRETEAWHTWRVKYYKGLGTSTSKEAKDYFSQMTRHRILFKYSGAEDDSNINLAFSKKKADERKEWLQTWLEDRKQRSDLGLPENYVYSKDMRSLTYTDFVNKELILFSNESNERSLPSVVDGLKPGQRKVLFTCLKRNLHKEIKVAQLAGSVAEMSAYHHGEGSLMSTIINLAQNYIGSNNLNLLEPRGQFGTRLHGGKDAASPRYIFTCLSPAARAVMHPDDEPLLKHNYDDNLRIEPVWYCPVIPMVLINGAEGIGTGWSTKVPNHKVRDVIANLRRMINGEDPLEMIPHYRDFKGEIVRVTDQRFVCSGEVAVLDDGSVEITELPVKTWTQNYKESVLEVFVNGKDKIKPCIQDYKEYHTDTTVRFVVKLTAEQLAAAEAVGLHKFFKLQSAINTTSMVLFDGSGCIKQYNNTLEILRDFFDLRLERYRLRKEYLEGLLAAESLRLENQARFICAKIDKEIFIENKPKKELIRLLLQNGYDSDPLKAWKQSQGGQREDSDEEEEEAEESADFNYILNMPLWSLTRERKDNLLKQRDAKAEELRKLRRKTPPDLWLEDLDSLDEVLKKIEAKGSADEEKKVKGGKKTAMRETMKSAFGRRIEPVIESAMKKLASERIKKGRATKPKAFKALDLGGDANVNSSDEEPKSLAERLKLTTEKKPEAAKKEKKPAVKKPPKEKKPPASKQQTLDAQLRKRKGKMPWDVSDSESEGDLNLSQASSSSSPRHARRAHANKKYNFDSESESEGEMQENPGVETSRPVVLSDSADEGSLSPDIRDSSGSEDAESLFEPPLALLTKATGAPASNGSTKTAVTKKKTLPKKPAPAKKAALPKKTVSKKKPAVAKKSKKPLLSDSDDDFTALDSSPLSLAPRRGRSTLRTKQAKYVESDSEDDILPPRKRKIKSDSDDAFQELENSDSDAEIFASRKQKRGRKV